VQNQPWKFIFFPLSLLCKKRICLGFIMRLVP
jgi:hypothetical protein